METTQYLLATLRQRELHAIGARERLAAGLRATAPREDRPGLLRRFAAVHLPRPRAAGPVCCPA
jgi:hypothetical protein